MLQNIWPFGLAMFSSDIAENINRFPKHALETYVKTNMVNLNLLYTKGCKD